MPTRPSRQTFTLLVVCFGLCISGIAAGSPASAEELSSNSLTDSSPRIDTTTPTGQPSSNIPYSLDSLRIVESRHARTQDTLARMDSGGIVLQSDNETPTQTSGEEGPAIVVTDLQANRTSAPVGAPVKISVTVENTGGIAGARTINIESLGDAAQRSVSLDVGETTTVSWVAKYPEAGNFLVQAGGKQLRLTIGSPNTNRESNTTPSGSMTDVTSTPVRNESAKFEIVSFDTSNTTVQVNEEVLIEVVVENTGDVSGTHRVALKENGEVTDSRQISLNQGKSSTINFDVSYGSPGTYEVSVGEQRFLVEVERGLSRNQGIQVGNSENRTTSANGSAPPATDDNVDESNNPDPSNSNSGSSEGGLGYFFIGFGLLVLVSVCFVGLEVYARWFH